MLDGLGTPRTYVWVSRTMTAHTAADPSVRSRTVATIGNPLALHPAPHSRMHSWFRSLCIACVPFNEAFHTVLYSLVVICYNKAHVHTML
jgi:hypothetical protein